MTPQLCYVISIDDTDNRRSKINVSVVAQKLLQSSVSLLRIARSLGAVGEENGKIRNFAYLSD